MPASSDLIIKFLTSVLADSKAIEMTDLIMEHFELALNLVEDCIVSKRFGLIVRGNALIFHSLRITI